MNATTEAEQLVKTHGSVRAASIATGIPRSTLRHRLRAAPPVLETETEELEYPNLPSSELPAEEIIEYASKNFAARLASRDARRWFEIKIKNNKPIGVCILGDPHIDFLDGVRHVKTPFGVNPLLHATCTVVHSTLAWG